MYAIYVVINETIKNQGKSTMKAKSTKQINAHTTHAYPKSTKTALAYTLAIIAMVGIALLALSSGRYPIAFSEVVSMLFDALRSTHSAQSQQEYLQQVILLDFRAPRVLLALIVGAGLSMCGCAFQSLFRNPLATPDILGVTNASSFGAVLALMLGLNMVGVCAFGFCFGIVSLVLVVAVSYSRFVPLSSVSMVLSGIIISALFSSLVSLVKYLADPQDTLPSITYWLLGSLSRVWSAQLGAGLIVVALGCVVLFALRWKLNLLALSEEEAKSLGVNLNTLRASVILSCTIIVSVSVCLCGVIGWIGLLIPHIARLLVGSENSRVLGLSAILGAGFLTLIDIISRSLSASEIPISILSAIVGAPFFIYILHKNKGGVRL